MVMSNVQLTEMMERVQQQLSDMSIAQDGLVASSATQEAAQQASAQALAELTQATDIMARGLDERIIACEGSIEELKKLLEESKHSDRSFRLFDSKSMKPNKFNGNWKLWKAWSRSVKAFLNSQYTGARRALEFVEKLDHKPEQADIDALKWKHGKDLNAGLYDVLITSTEGEPQGMVINCKSEEGLAAWRKLSNFYEPRGGESDVDRLNNLLSWPRAKRMEQISATVEGWDSALCEYVERTGEEFPERFKVNLLLRMLPTEAEAEIRMRHVTGKMITYEALREIIEAWIVQMAHKNIAQHLDAICQEEERRQGPGQEQDQEEDLDALKANSRGAIPKAKAKAKAKAGRFDGDCAYCKKSMDTKHSTVGPESKMRRMESRRQKSLQSARKVRTRVPILLKVNKMARSMTRLAPSCSEKT